MNNVHNDVMAELIHRGVTIHCPESVYIAPDVDPERISRDGVVLHPGTRLRGPITLIGPGCVIGEETPATLEDCALGKRVNFKGGYATKSAMLDDVTVGSGAQIREGCLLEEHSSAAHNVGLKQTILMPYATLGSLINFCDVLLAGGTGRHDHSEVGSGFIHFNFTPGGTKATASLFGDVPHGVFVREHRIFLGGNAGAVGPLRVGYGAVVAAGSLLRDDVADDEFVVTGPHETTHRPAGTVGRPTASKIHGVIDRNIAYIAQLRVLRLWYTSVRWAFCGRFRLGSLLNLESQAVIDRAIEERVKRLRELAAVFDADQQTPTHRTEELAAAAIEAALNAELPVSEDVIQSITEAALRRDVGYLDTLAGLDDDTIATGQAWLQSAVDACTTAARDAIGRASGKAK